MLPDLSTNRSTTVERVVDALRSAMFEGALPAGTPLREVELAEEMKVSRGSVREALLTLHGEGLVARPSFRSVEVRRLDSAEIHDLFLTRGLVELAAVDRYRSADEAARADLESAIADFVKVVHSGELAQQNEADLEVHRALVRTLGSPRLSRIHDGLIAELKVALAAQYVSADAVPADDLIERHVQFMMLMRSGDLGGAHRQLAERLAVSEGRLTTAAGPS